MRRLLGTLLALSILAGCAAPGGGPGVPSSVPALASSSSPHAAANPVQHVAEPRPTATPGTETTSMPPPSTTPEDPAQGCGAACPPPDGVAIASIPANWGAGAAMRLVSLATSHSGWADATLLENGSTVQQPPASCAVYRNVTQFDVDTCRVGGYSDQRAVPWTLSIAWDDRASSGGYFVPGQRVATALRVVAYDDAGSPIAWWNGAYDEQDFSWATE